ncbi:hypothetical protein ACP4OV_008618 [Aristida adscensionis]
MSRVKGEPSSAGSTDLNHLPLVNCRTCEIPVVRLRSKRPESYGEVLFKCENDIKNDKNKTCNFYKWAPDYVRKLIDVNHYFKGFPTQHGEKHESISCYI